MQEEQKQVGISNTSIRRCKSDAERVAGCDARVVRGVVGEAARQSFIRFRLYLYTCALPKA